MMKRNMSRFTDSNQSQTSHALNVLKLNVLILRYITLTKLMFYSAHLLAGQCQKVCHCTLPGLFGKGLYHTNIILKKL